MYIAKVTKFIYMFTGIIETLGRVEKIEKDRKNINFTIQTNITHELKIDQSVAHNGVCLTVVAISGKNYVVTAIKETLDKTNLGLLSETDLVNIERAMKLGDRLDGHIVQGHVDQTAVCTEISENNGSWIFRDTLKNRLLYHIQIHLKKYGPIIGFLWVGPGFLIFPFVMDISIGLYLLLLFVLFLIYMTLTDYVELKVDKPSQI